MTKFLRGLIGNQNDKSSNPFQMSESVRRDLVTRAEEAGARAMSWNMSDFDKIGGRGVIRRMWNGLKSDGLVCGIKRSVSVDSDECEENKKFKLSLNLSGTCELIDNIELAAGGDDSLSVSLDSRKSFRVDFREVVHSEDEGEAFDLVPESGDGMARNVIYYRDDAVVGWNLEVNHVLNETLSSESSEISLYDAISSQQSTSTQKDFFLDRLL